MFIRVNHWTLSWARLIQPTCVFYSSKVNVNIFKFTSNPPKVFLLIFRWKIIYFSLIHSFYTPIESAFFVSTIMIVPSSVCRHTNCFEETAGFIFNGKSTLTATSNETPHHTSQYPRSLPSLYFPVQTALSEVTAPFTCNPSHSLRATAMSVRFIYINCVFADRSCRSPPFSPHSLVSNSLLFRVVHLHILLSPVWSAVSRCVLPRVFNCLHFISPQEMYLQSADRPRCCSHNSGL